MESVGFKEWALVCEALGSGEQTIILRKGGIAEGREGFSFKHREFFLFPTFFHEQVERIRGARRELPVAREGEIEIRFFAKVDFAVIITSCAAAEALESYHILAPEVVRERFHYEETPGIHVAFVRVFRIAPTWRFPDARQYGGCRSWLKLPDVPHDIALDPVLSEPDYAARLADFRVITSREAAAVV